MKIAVRMEVVAEKAAKAKIKLKEDHNNQAIKKGEFIEMFDNTWIIQIQSKEILSIQWLNKINSKQ